MKRYSSTTLLAAAIAGGEAIAAVYRRALLAQKATPGNKRMVHAYEAVGVKAAVFKDGTGAWCIVGPATGISDRRPLAPQAIFGEHGTQERWTKAGAYRGRMPVQKWLQNANNSAKAASKAAILEVLRRGY
jgi:hypothetical protein